MVLYTANKLLNKKINIKRMILSAVIISLLVAPLHLASLYLSLNFNILFAYCIDTFRLLLTCISIYLLIEKNWWKAFISSSFACFIVNQTYALASPATSLTNQSAWAISTLSILLIGLSILTYFTAKLIEKTHIPSLISSCVSRPIYCYIGALLGFFLTGYSYFVYILSDILLVGSSSISAIFILVIVIGLFEIYTRGLIRQDREKQQQILITQQQAYIESLEDIQKEVRMYRHDYKNMISGIYWKAQEGNFDYVHSFMHSMFEEFELNIGNKINLTNQLSNIYVTELKSLLMHKIMIMKKQSITFHLEVLYPIYQIAMDEQDLNRCIGILLDNAIESVTNTEGSIDIIITAIDNEVSFLIENNIYQEISITKINQDGFSTKGDNRGHGLFSFQEIINKYENITSMTSIQNNRFFQEVKIQGGTP